MNEPMSQPSPAPRTGSSRRWRRGGRAAAFAFAGLLALSGCSDDAGIEGDAPEADGEPPRDPDPEVQENAPNVVNPDLSGDETPPVEPNEDVDGDTAEGDSAD